MDKDYINLLPGLMQGITRVCISYPFDVLKINMQANIFQNNKEALSHIFKNDIFRLYRGSSFMFLNIGMERSIQYYVMEKYNKKYNPYMLGFGISLFSSIYTIPVQYITTNLVVSSKTKMINILKSNIYRGGSLEIFKNILSTTLYNGTYFSLRNKIKDDIYYSPFYSTISSFVTWSIIYPIDTIKVKYQVTKNITLIKVVKDSINNGIINLYKGISFVYMRTIPSSIIGMYVYEYTKLKING
jgi:hypothetical protein